MRALQDPAHGKALLGANNRPFAFWAKEECKVAPVFVSEKTSLSAAGQKHPSDAAAPGLGDNYVPLNSVHTGKTLVTLSKTIGLDGTVGAAVLRRTWSLNAQTRGSLPAHPIAANMEHSRGSQALHQDIYVPTQRPEDTAGFARPELASSSVLAQGSLARAGAVEQLPRELTDEHRDELSHALGAYLSAVSEDSDVMTVADAVDEGDVDGGDDSEDLGEGLLLFETHGDNNDELGNTDGDDSSNGNGDGVPPPARSICSRTKLA